MIKHLLAGAALSLALACGAHAQGVIASGPPQGGLVVPTYSGFFHWPLLRGNTAAGSALTANTIVCTPAFWFFNETITQMATRITAINAGSNIAGAFYLNNPATGRPGKELFHSSNMAGTVAQPVTAAAAGTIPAGLVWECGNADNSVNAAVVDQAANTSNMPSFVGSATELSIMTAAGTPNLYVSTPSTFGTWGDLSAATWTEHPNATAYVLFAVKD